MGRVTLRQRSVRTGWTNLTGTNIVIARKVTSTRLMYHGMLSAKITSTSMFQQPGKPEKELSFVFMRVSAKYIALAKVTMMIMSHPLHPSIRPDLNSAKAGMKT